MMRSLLQTVINALLSADADAVVGAEYGRPSATRTAQRNGYRHRDLDTPRRDRGRRGPEAALGGPTSPSGSWSAASEPSPR